MLAAAFVEVVDLVIEEEPTSIFERQKLIQRIGYVSALHNRFEIGESLCLSLGARLRPFLSKTSALYLTEPHGCEAAADNTHQANRRDYPWACRTEWLLKAAGYQQH